MQKWAQQAMLELQAGHIEEAQALYADMRRQFPNERTPYWASAEIYLMQGHLQEAFDLYEEMTRRFPHDLPPHVKLTETLLRGGMGEESLRVSGEILTRFPDAVEGSLLTARALILLGRRNAARDTLLAVGKKFPRSVDVDILLSNLEEDRGDLAAACKRAVTAWRKSPDREELLVAAVNLLVYVGRYDDALRHLGEAAPQHKDSAPLLERLAHVYEEANRPDEALSTARVMITRFPDLPDGYMVQARALMALGRDDEALASLLQEQERFHNDMAFMSFLAQASACGGNYERALTVYETMQRNFPHFSGGFVGYCQTLADLGRLEEAEQACHETLEHFPFEGFAYQQLAATQRANLKAEKMLSSTALLREKFSPPPAPAQPMGQEETLPDYAEHVLVQEKHARLDQPRLRLWVKNPPLSADSGPADRASVLWLDLGPMGEMLKAEEWYWQDHGLGLLRTILKEAGIKTELASLRTVKSWAELEPQLKGYDTLCMNVRSYTYPYARLAAEMFKRLNPGGTVLAGGMHASVALADMLEVEAFDHICQGPGEKIIVDLVRNPGAFPRLVQGKGAQSMGEWPMIDRSLWPQPVYRRVDKPEYWPLEPKGWGEAPVASVLTSRVCPWQCAFCNEASYIPAMGRRPVEQVIEELNHINRTWGPIGSVVIHDSNFFQQPSWLEEWIDKYPRMADKTWEYWAAGRADTVRHWPELFEALVMKTNLRTFSIGLESGSDNMLRLLNKESTEEDQYFAISLINKLGDRLEAMGQKPLTFWTNLMFGIPGETRHDAFKTIAMLRTIHRANPSIAFFAPYPGAALGYQIIAENKSVMSKNKGYQRNADEAKVTGVDYQFYWDLLQGKYEKDVAACLEDLKHSGMPVYSRVFSA